MSVTAGRVVIDTNGAAAVTVVPSPTSGLSHIIPPKGINVHNDSGGAVDAIIRFNDGATTYIIARNATLATNAVLSNDGPVTLTATADLIEVILGGAGTIPVVASYLIQA